MSQILAVLFAFLLSLVGFTSLWNAKAESDRTIKHANVAQQFKTFSDASKSYVQQYWTALQAAATATTPAIVTVPMLQAVNLLPASFNPQNAYQQSWQLDVLQPTAGNLLALAISTGGQNLLDKDLTKIAQMANGSAGFIPQSDSKIYTPLNAYGAYSSWGPISIAGFTGASSGHLAGLLSFTNGQLSTNYLYRNAVPGQPQLNQMNTTLDMNGNSIANANQINAVSTVTSGNASVGGNSTVAGTLNVTGKITTPNTTETGDLQLDNVVVEGTACPQNGRTARDANGLLLSCQSDGINTTWNEQSIIHNNSVNYGTSDFVNDCTGSDPSHYPCRYVQYAFNATRVQFISASLFASGPSSGGDDVITAIAVDGGTCANNRMIATSGWTGLTSTACTRWVQPGAHTVLLMVNGSTGFVLKSGTTIIGGVASF